MTLKTKWLLLGAFAVLPYLVLAAAGAWWLYRAGWGLWWLAGAAAISLAGWPLLRWLRRRTPVSTPPNTGPAKDWSPAGQAAWAKVEAIATRVEAEDVPFDRAEPLLALGGEVIDVVAREFHPRSKNPALEIPVPHLLRIVELVTRDLREVCTANIPGAHILTINDLVKLKHLVDFAPTLFRLYRLGAFIIDPAGALARELSSFAQDRMLSASADETKRWLVQFAVRKTGFYAIELYSGHWALRGVEFAAYTTERSQETIALERERTSALEREPLRILVIGQVKAGKSSLVNALFGETKAAVDVVPRTTGVDAYLLERAGLKRAIILDTAGYEDASGTATALNEAREEIERCDLIVLVSSAGTAARDSDRRLLDEVRALFQRHPDRELPPLVIALTHVDQLRPFREWAPPYDLVHPQTAKARHIREALEGTAEDLAVDMEDVVPVCLAEGRLYNVDEGLIPVILNSLSGAQRLKYLRCLRELKDEEYWRQLRSQAVNAGRVILRTGLELLNRGGRSE